MKHLPALKLAGAALAGALALSACGSSASSASSSDPNAWATVNVGIALSPPKAIFFGPYVAQQEGFFAREHLHVHFISMPNGLQTELGTTAGSIDFGFSSGTDSIEAAAARADPRDLVLRHPAGHPVHRRPGHQQREEPHRQARRVDRDGPVLHHAAAGLPGTRRGPPEPGQADQHGAVGVRARHGGQEDRRGPSWCPGPRAATA
jgi:hypothetical protein